MIGDTVNVRSHHYPPARAILELTEDRIRNREYVYAFSIGGESGSGKSTLSLAVKDLLEKKNIKPFIFHMDDYFLYPPQTNHDRRINDISIVGTGEVKLELLQQHINEVKDGVEYLRKPLVHYRENVIREVIIDMNNIDVIIAEGTYTTLLENIDCKVFMLRNYMDTRESRVKRARDPLIPFNEKVLKKEHEIIRNHEKMADILVDREYNVKPVSERFDT